MEVQVSRREKEMHQEEQPSVDPAFSKEEVQGHGQSSRTIRDGSVEEGPDYRREERNGETSKEKQESLKRSLREGGGAPGVHPPNTH